MKYSKLAEQFESMNKLPLFEIAMIDNEYLLVDSTFDLEQNSNVSTFFVENQFNHNDEIV